MDRDALSQQLENDRFEAGTGLPTDAHPPFNLDPDGSINVQYLASPSQPNTIIVGQDTATALTFDPVTGMPGSYTGTAYNLSSGVGEAFLLAA
jgi:hypothetical protein